MAIFSKRDFQIRTFVVTQKKRASFTRLYNYYIYVHLLLLRDSDGNNITQQ